MSVHPLIFQPILKPKIWGGRRLETHLRKRLPPGQPIGESWEIADLEDDQSEVAVGPSAGKTLAALLADWGPDLLGRAEPFDGRFPLLIKFLDANDTLSVQVHPDEATARRLGGRVRVKNEAWYVIDAAAAGFIYRDVREGTDAVAFRRALMEGQVESLLHRLPARKGHCFYLPSGTMHALGAGVLVAEVQTPSDVTYRVYDYNRVDPSTGQTRELHVDQALDCINFETKGNTSSRQAQPKFPEEKKEHVASLWTAVTRLVHCPSFSIERVRMIDGVEQNLPYSEMAIWIVLEGSASITWKGGDEPLRFGIGDTVLLPAALADGRVRTHDDCMWLEVTVPVRSSLAGFERPSRAELSQPPGGGFVPLNLPER